MDSIVIGFSRPKSFFEPFSWLIRLVTWSNFSHAYIKYYNTYANRWEIFQSSGLSVNFVGQILFDSKEIVCYEFEIPLQSNQKQTLIQNAIDKVGLPYGVGQIFGFAWVLLMRLFGKNVKNPFYNANSFVCSELVVDMLNQINGTNLNSSSMTPKDVYNYILSKGYKPVSGE